MTDTIDAGAACVRRNPIPALRDRISRPAPAPSRRAGPPTSSTHACSAARIAAKLGKARLARGDRAHARAARPARHDYRLGIVPASDTGAIEMAIWSLLGPRPVTMLAWESFGEGWVTDVGQAIEARRRHPHAPIMAQIARSERHRSGERRRRSPGTARPAACASPTPTGSPTTGRASASATRPRARLRAGHRLGEDRCRHLQLAEGASAARRRTACWCCRPRAVERLESAAGAAPAAEDFPSDARAAS